MTSPLFLELPRPTIGARPLVYLCGSIGGKTQEEALAWRFRATELLAPEFGVLNPLRDLEATRGAYSAHSTIEARETSKAFSDNEIVERDLLDIRLSRLVLRHYLGPSEGSPMECVYAKLYGVPTIVSGIADPSAVSPWLRYHAVKLLPTLEEATTYIKRYWSYNT